MDAGGCVVEDLASLACGTLAVHLTAGIQMSVGGAEVEGGSGQRRGAGGRGRGGSDGGGGREEVRGAEGGRENVRSWGGGGLGEEMGRGKVVKATGGRGRGGRGREAGTLGGWGRVSKEFLFVSVSTVQVEVSLLKPREFKTQGLGGGGSRVQSGGLTTFGSDRSSTALEIVGRVEKEK